MWIRVCGLLLVGLAPAVAWAQVDVAVDSVQVTPSPAQPDQAVTVRAVIRRPSGPNVPAFKASVDVEVEFALVSDGKPFAVRTVVALGEGQSRAVDASWPARPGQHVFRVRIVGVLMKGQKLQELNAGNNQRTSATLLVQAAASAPPGGEGPIGRPVSPGGAIPPSGGGSIPQPGVGSLSGPARTSVISGVLVVPPDLVASYRVTIEGVGGQRQVASVTGSKDRRPFRFDSLPAGDYRVTPEVVASATDTPLPMGGWAPPAQRVTLRVGERLEGARGLEFRYGVPQLARPPTVDDGRLGRAAAPLVADRRPVDAPIWLRVNGGLWAELETGARMVLSWDLPEDAAFPHVFVNLRVERDGALAEEFLLRRCFLRDYCFSESVLEPPPGATPSPASFATYNDDALGPPESGVEPSIRRRATPRHGELAMRAASDYHPWVAYTFQVVYHHPGDLVLRSSNPVTVTVRNRMASAPPPSALPDLAVTLLDILRTGPDAGRLTVVVGDVSGHRPPFSGRVPYRITTLRDPVSSDAPSPVEEGTVEFTSAGLGAFRSTFRVPPGTDPLLVRVEVDPAGTIAEARRANNARERYLRGTGAAPRVHEVWKEQEGPLWMLLGVRWSDMEGVRLMPYIDSVTRSSWEITFHCQWLGALADSPLSPRGVDQVGYVFCAVGRFDRVLGVAPLTTHAVLFRGDGPALRPHPDRPGSILSVPVAQTVPIEKVWNLPEALHDVGPALPELGVRLVRAAIQLRDRPYGRHEVEQAVLFEITNTGRAPLRSVALGSRAFAHDREQVVAADLAAGTTMRYCDRFTYVVGDPARYFPVSVLWTARLTSPVVALGSISAHGDFPLRDQGSGLWSRGGAAPGGSLSGVCAE